MKKFFIGIAVLLAAAIVAVCTLDVGTGWIARKGAEYVANTYNLGVSIGGAKGNPVKGYTFNDIELTRDGTSLIKAGKIFVDPALLKLITGNVALDWVELGDIKSTIPHLLQLAEIFTGRKVTLPSAVPLNDLQLHSVGGTLDGDEAEAAFDIALNGLPMKGSFKLSLASGLTIDKGSVQTAGGTISVSGGVAPELNLKAAVSKVQVGDLAALVPQLESFLVKGRVTADMTVTGALDNPAAVGTVSFDDGSVMAFPVSASATVAMKDMKINLVPLAVNAIGIPTKGEVFADLGGKTPSIKVNMNTDGPVTAETLRKNLPSLPAELSGQVDAVNVAVEGPVNALKGNAQVRADKLTLGGASVTDTLFKAAFDSKGLIAVSGGSNIAGNPATLKGTVNAGGKEVAADVAFSVKDFDLAMLPKIVPSAPANIKGKVNAAFTVKGKGSAIAAGGKIDSQRVSLNDMNIDKVNVPVAFQGSTVTFKNASLVFMELPVTKVNGSITMGSDNLAFKEMSAVVANGTIKMDSVLKFGKNLNGTYDLKLNGIDLGSVMNTFGAASLGASGKLSGGLKGELSDTDITGDGSLSIPVFSLTGLKFEQIKSSVKLSKMVASLPDFSSKFASGTIDGNASMDINKMTYAIGANLKGSQLKTIIDQMAPALGGGLTGTLTGEYKASGKLSPFTLDGEGSVSSAGGKMYGFKQYQSIVNAIAALHGNKGIAYANARIPFANDIAKLTLKDGTVINAEKGDGIYQYIKAKGTFAYDGNLDINVDGSINAMLVNTAASTLSGAIAAGGATALLTGGAGGIAGLIGGGIAGASKSWGVNDFRNLTFHIGGTVDDPKIGSFKVNGKTWDAKEAQQENAKVTDVKDQAKNAVEKAKEDAVNKLTEKLTGKSGAESGSSKNSVRDQLNDALNKELEKGLNSLFGK